LRSGRFEIGFEIGFLIGFSVLPLAIPGTSRTFYPYCFSSKRFAIYKIRYFSSFLRIAAQRRRAKGFFFTEKGILASGTKVRMGTCDAGGCGCGGLQWGASVE
jgi:hypothetical protein